MSIIARMACGCALSVDGDTAPVCEVHRETRVQSVQTPPPKFTAVNCRVTGPHVRQISR